MRGQPCRIRLSPFVRQVNADHTVRQSRKSNRDRVPPLLQPGRAGHLAKAGYRLSKVRELDKSSLYWADYLVVDQHSGAVVDFGSAERLEFWARSEI